MIVGAMLALALSYVQRSGNNVSQRQAYETSRCAVDLFVDSMRQGNTESDKLYRTLSASFSGGPVVKEFTVDFGHGMGTSKVRAELYENKKRDKRMFITATTPSNKGDCVVSATLFGARRPLLKVKDRTGVEVEISLQPIYDAANKPMLQWILLGYSDGEKVDLGH